MKNHSYSFLKTKLKGLLIISLSILTTFLMAQPMNITVTGCNAGPTFNGDYSLDSGSPVCNSCTSYKKTDANTFIFRSQANNTVWSGGITSINCNTLIYVMQSGETDCDPTNGAISQNDCVITETAMPVEMISFNAEVLFEKSVRLIWEVASEVNNEGFEIERSTDGISFSAIGFERGRGNAIDAMEYNYDDQDLAAGKIYYYRLKQMDFDGRFIYFKTVSVALKGAETAIGDFYPNPTSGSATIDLFTKENKEWSVEAFDMSGKVHARFIYQLSKGENRIELDFSTMESGLYFMKFENGQEQVYRKLSIQKK